MNVLLISPTCLPSFWSFETILSLLDKDAHSPALGLLTVAALLPQDWEFTYIEERVSPPTKAQWAACDLVFISGMYVQRPGIVDAIKEAKKRGKKVVAGGAWVYHEYEDAIDAGADIVVIGECETSIKELIKAIENNETGLIIKGEGWADLKTTPVPRYDLIDISRYVEMPIQFARGCPFECEFCDVTQMFGQKGRVKEPEQIIEELQALYDTGWHGMVFFVDDNLISLPGKAKTLMHAVIKWQKERGYPFKFVTQASINMAIHDELLSLMVKAGFYRVFIGIESTDKETLIKYNKVQNAACDIDKACNKVCKAGMQIIAGCILGFDGEAPDSGQGIIDFSERNNIADTFITLLQAVPGSKMWERLEKEGREPFFTTEGNEGNSSGLMNFRPTRPIEKIVEEFIGAYDTLYEPSAYLERSYKQYAMMDPLPYKAARKVPQWGEIKAMAAAAFRQGFLYSSRFTYWKLMFKALWNFPDRLDKFIASSVFLEHLYHFKEGIAIDLREQLSRRKEQLTSTENLPVSMAIPMEIFEPIPVQALKP
jgi:radical SAM superfamily enzyme YgiQ (UPF0313 family)